MKKNNYFFKIKETLKLCLIGAGIIISSSALFAQDITNGLKLHYDFSVINNDSIVPDVSGNGYNGVIHDATIGLSNGKNSLILGTTGTGWLDMGANTGNLVASLNDFSMSCYVWVNSTYTKLNNNGNMIATFSNSLNSYGDANGYMFLQAKRSRYSITPAHYTSEQAAQVGTNVAQGKWVHFTYTQSADTGRFYENGILKDKKVITMKPSELGATPYNMLAKPSYTGDLYLQDAQISDFRMYNRGITQDEVLILNGYPSDLISALKNLKIEGNLSEVTSNLTLPTTVGSIPVTWKSNFPNTIDSTGKVVRPEQYDVTVKLTATLKQTVNDVTYTLTKEFIAIVLATNLAGEQIAEWDFSGSTISEVDGVVTVEDIQSGFKGKLMNDASIRTIGTTEQYNVLDLGNGTGYFDMGTDIGKAVYALNDYTMFGYFYIADDYTELDWNGNFIWNFSNSADAPTDMNGYIIGSLKAQSQSITSKYWAIGNQAVGANANAPKGGWHHFAYSQSGTTGTIYVDGVQVAQSAAISNLPSTTLPIEGREGTLYNWLGRSCYPGDVYLRKTLLYDFQLLRISLNADDLNSIFEVTGTIEKLNTAYAENPQYLYPELTTEMENLNPGDLSALTSDITLPSQGTSDTSIKISWKSTNDSVLNGAGKVIRPSYFPYTVTLTATLSKNGQKVTKTFSATVLAKDGSQFTGDLLVHHDFNNVSDSLVTDAAEKHLTATLKNNAKVVSMGTSKTFKVLEFGDTTNSYLDLGPEVGKLMYNLNDFTLAAYYRIDLNYTGLANNGNFIWSFANTNNALNTATGYLIGILKDQSISITPGNYSAASGNQSVGFSTPALQGNWHHFAYTQSGTVGTIYVDGIPVVSGEITNTLSTTLPKEGKLGTAYNWLGRSCYTGDVYLRSTLISDFRLYKKALNDDEIQNSVLAVGNTISDLENAYIEGFNALKNISETNFKVIPMKGAIQIKGITANDKVSLFDVAGRNLQITNTNKVLVNSGIYIVRINNYVTKVVVE